MSKNEMLLSENNKGIHLSKLLELLIKLQIQNMESFNGDTEKWFAFEEKFNKLIEMDHFSPEEKINLLYSALAGEPLKLMVRLLEKDKNVSEIMKFLRRHYSDRLQRKFLLKMEWEYTPLYTTGMDFIQFSDNLRSFVIWTKIADCEGCFSDRNLMNMVLARVPERVREKFFMAAFERESEIATTGQKLDLVDLQKIVEYEADIEFKKMDSRGKRSYVGKIPKYYCPECLELHRLCFCPVFKGFDPDTRWYKIMQYGLCTGCLYNDHVTKDCLSKKKCGVEGCRERHHSLLHFKNRNN
jgi:hypothetical protein